MRCSVASNAGVVLFHPAVITISLGVQTRVEYFSMCERLADFSAARQIVTTPPTQN
jgi:hypothetical protein